MTNDECHFHCTLIIETKHTSNIFSIVENQKSIYSMIKNRKRNHFVTML